MNTIRWKHYITVLAMLLVIILFSGCSGKSSSGEHEQFISYDIGEGNHVLLGPVEGARITVYKVSDMEKPVSTGESGKYGKYEVSLSDVDAEDILLVVAEGGEDIDFDDDGFKDAGATPFNDKLHLLCRAEDIEKGRANVSIVSDLVYQYVKHLVPHIGEKISTEDFWDMVDLAANELVDAKEKKSGYGNVVSFNPLTDKDDLKFDFSKLFANGEMSLMHLYHKGGDVKGKQTALFNFFREMNLSLHDDRLLKLRKNMKLSVSMPSGVSVDVSTQSGKIQSFEELKENDYFVPKNEHLTLKIESVEDDFKVLRWRGCDKVSDDKMACEVFNAGRDRVITPIVVPKETKLHENLEIVDASKSVVKMPSATNPIRLIRLTSDKLDTVEIYVDMKDQTLKETLKNLAENGLDNKTYVLTNTVQPAFFRKITAVEKLQNSDYRYKVTTEFIRLTDVVKQGYISTQLGGMTEKMPSGLKLVSSSYILPDGHVLPVRSRDDALVMNFTESGTVEMSVISPRGMSWSEDFEKSYSYNPDKNKTKVDVNITGKVVLRPSVTFDMSWKKFFGAPYAIKQVATSAGVAIDTNNTLVMKYKKKYGVRKELWEKPIVKTQTFSIYGIPVVISEQINFIVGIKGPGKGEENNESYVEGNVTLNADLGVGATLEIGYTPDNGLCAAFDLSESHKLEGTVAAKIGAYGYIGAVPGIALYGIGIQMDNCAGPYVTASFNGTTSTTGTDIEDVDYNATLNVEAGLGYYGLIQMYVNKPKYFEDTIDEIVKKVNNWLRNKKYSEFWKQWPYLTYETSWENAKRETAEALGEDYPGILTISGNNISIEKEQNTQFDSSEYSYTLKNVGGKAIGWKMEATSGFPVTIVISSGSVSQTVMMNLGTVLPNTRAISGTLEAGESATVSVEIPGFALDHAGDYEIALNFYQNDETESNSNIIPLPGLPGILNSNGNPVAQKFISLTVKAQEWDSNLSAEIAGIKMKNLVLHWDKDAAPGSDGFTIHYCEADETTTTGCKNDEELDFATVNADQSEYVMSMAQAINSGVLKWGKSYLFRIYAYDHHPAFNMGSTYVPASTFHYYGGRSNELATPPSPGEGIEPGRMVNDAYVIMEPGCYNDGDAKGKLILTIENLFASKPEDSTLKVGVILDRFENQFTAKKISLNGDKTALITAINSLDFPPDGTSAIPNVLESLDTMTWTEGAQKNIVMLVGNSTNISSGDGSIGGVANISSIRNELMQRNIMMMGIGLNGAIPETSSFKTLMDFDLPVSNLGDSSTVVPELQESMLPPPVF